MEHFGVMLKSYAPDLAYAARFVDSYFHYVQDETPLALVVPDGDRPAFAEVLRGRGELLPESLWSKYLVDYPIHGNSPGYMNQQIIKLAFAEQGLFANYLCADSEAVFIRPFSSSDFMAEDQLPYTFVTEDHALSIDSAYEAAYGAARRRMLEGLREYLDLPRQPLATCHGLGVFNVEVLRSLKDFLSDRGLDYAAALEICPYEFSWYNFWLEREGTIPRVVREPVFLTLHLKHQYLALMLEGVSLDDLAQSYVGVLVNSGFSRAHGLVGYPEARSRSLGRYLSEPELLAALGRRTFRPRRPRGVKPMGPDSGL